MTQGCALRREQKDHGNELDLESVKPEISQT
jgi:hypothetical protein